MKKNKKSVVVTEGAQLLHFVFVLFVLLFQEQSSSSSVPSSFSGRLR